MIRTTLFSTYKRKNTAANTAGQRSTKGPQSWSQVKLFFFLTQTFKRTISKVQKMINVNDQSPIELCGFYYLYANPKLNTTEVTINYSYYL